MHDRYGSPGFLRPTMPVPATTNIATGRVPAETRLCRTLAPLVGGGAMAGPSLWRPPIRWPGRKRRCSSRTCRRRPDPPFRPGRPRSIARCCDHDCVEVSATDAAVASACLLSSRSKGECEGSDDSASDRRSLRRPGVSWGALRGGGKTNRHDGRIKGREVRLRFGVFFKGLWRFREVRLDRAASRLGNFCKISEPAVARCAGSGHERRGRFFASGQAASALRRARSAPGPSSRRARWRPSAPAAVSRRGRIERNHRSDVRPRPGREHAGESAHHVRSRW